MSKIKHLMIGSSLDDWLREEGMLEALTEQEKKRLEMPERLYQIMVCQRILEHRGKAPNKRRLRGKHRKTRLR